MKAGGLELLKQVIIAEYVANKILPARHRAGDPCATDALAECSCGANRQNAYMAELKNLLNIGHSIEFTD